MPFACLTNHSSLQRLVARSAIDDELQQVSRQAARQANNKHKLVVYQTSEMYQQAKVSDNHSFVRPSDFLKPQTGRHRSSISIYINSQTPSYRPRHTDPTMPSEPSQHIELNQLHPPSTSNLQSDQPTAIETQHSNRSPSSSPTHPQPHQQQDDINTTPPSLHATFAPSPRTSAISHSPFIGTVSTLVPTIPILPATRPRRNPPPPSMSTPWPWLLILKLTLLPIYLSLWAWLFYIPVLLFGNTNKNFADELFGDVGLSFVFVGGPILFIGLMTRFYLRY